jgi:hypothetical protein
MSIKRSVLNYYTSRIFCNLTITIVIVIVIIITTYIDKNGDNRIKEKKDNLIYI